MLQRSWNSPVRLWPLLQVAFEEPAPTRLGKGVSIFQFFPDRRLRLCR
jgi:hypothetical protein